MRDPAAHSDPRFCLSICGLTELDRRLKHFRPTHVISINDPGDCGPFFPDALGVLRLNFYDVQAPTSLVARLYADEGPELAHVVAIRDFGCQLPAGARVLVHCGAGISRSTAAAFLLLCLRKPGREGAAYRWLRRLRPQARPNPMIVRFADGLLGAEGRMIACLPKSGTQLPSRSLG